KDLRKIHDYSCGPDAIEGVLLDTILIGSRAYRVNFVGSNSQSEGKGYVAENKRSYYHNYFIGNEPEKWAGHVGLYGEVVRKNLYDGIDMKVYSGSEGAMMKYDLIVSAGASAAQIQVSFEGVTPELTK